MTAPASIGNAAESPRSGDSESTGGQGPEPPGGCGTGTGWLDGVSCGDGAGTVDEGRGDGLLALDERGTDVAHGDGGTGSAEREDGRGTATVGLSIDGRTDVLVGVGVGVGGHGMRVGSSLGSVGGAMVGAESGSVQVGVGEGLGEPGLVGGAVAGSVSCGVGELGDGVGEGSESRGVGDATVRLLRDGLGCALLVHPGVSLGQRGCSGSARAGAAAKRVALSAAAAPTTATRSRKTS